MLRSSEGAKLISIGALAARSGVAVSAIRFYEDKGLLTAKRSGSGHRRFPRETLRRVSFIRITQSLGYSLDEIRGYLETLPEGRTPTKADWARLSRTFSKDIEQRIVDLKQLQGKLTACIGCGCLSLKNCSLYNPQDVAGGKGDGPRYLLGDTPPKR